MPRGIHILLFALLLLPTFSARAQVQLERYLKKDGYGVIKISPDGRYYAATTPMADRTGLVILRRADGKIVDGAAGVENSVVDDFWWVSDDRLVIAMAERLGSRDEPYRTGQLFSLGVDGKHVRTLVGPKAHAGLVDVIDYNPQWEMADLIDTIPGDPRNVLISVSQIGQEPQTNVDKMDVYTGYRTPVATAPVSYATFLTDAAGRVRFAKGSKNDNYSKLYYRADDKADWRLINDEMQSRRVETPVGFSVDGNVAYLVTTQPQGPDAIVAWDTRSGERKQVLRDHAVDPYAVILDRDRHTVLGAQYMSDGVHTRLLPGNDEGTRLYRALEKAFPGSAVSVTSYTRDGIALVQVWNDRMPGDTFLFDPHKMTADGIFAQREWFDPLKLPKMREITVHARDGLMLHGYLTLPLTAVEGKPVPMVVMPHGGPYGIFDRWAFDDDAQMLAEAGYAVLQVNFRGSGNYGVAFEQAGARQWAGTMQDDLTDATRWAIDQHVADPSRICIYGASYGGYAALTGAAKEPDLYRCAVGYVGVYDLEAMHREKSRYAAWLRNWEADWVGKREEMAARSPVNMAANIKAKVLLAAGGEDKTAPIAHTKRMAKALRDAGKPVETLYFDSEGHGFYTEAHRREFYTRLLDFLADNLGGARAAKP